MRTFVGDVFIVPNGLVMCSEVVSNICSTQATRKLASAHSGDAVEVWMTGEGCDNWDSHYHGVRIAYLPIAMLEGKSEGDVIEFDTETSEWDGHKELIPGPCKVRLTLAQTKYRYRNHGDFQTTLQKLIALNEKFRKEHPELC